MQPCRYVVFCVCLSALGVCGEEVGVLWRGRVVYQCVYVCVQGGGVWGSYITVIPTPARASLP